MKNQFFKMASCAIMFLCCTNLTAQKKFKIGDEFDANIKVTKEYQQFSQSGSQKTNQPQLVFQKEFYSKNSTYVKLYFENFDLAPDDYVEITGVKSGEKIIYGGQGKIVDDKMTMISNFWSQVIFDDKVEVKLYATGSTSNYNGFEISKVAYGFTKEKIVKQYEKNDPQQKSICSSDNKERIACYEGTDMFEKAKAVCRLIIGGSSSCTGWLLGSEGHLMTNNHCIGSSSDAQNTDFIFNYQYASCTGSTSATSQTVASSSTFIKTNSTLDYTLVKLPTNPTGSYGYLSLSSTVASSGDRIYIPQHPGGRRKEISVNTDSGFSSVNCVGNCGTANAPGKTINYFADTEGGSSGSPVIDYNSNLVLAIHNTGQCPNGSYGRSDDLIASIGNDMPANGVDGNGGGNPDPDPDPSCTSTVTSFPYSESFESNDGWTQVTGDDGNWVRDASGTPSSGTGPSSGANGSFYMFLEASTNGSTGQIGSNATAILQSPCFDLSGLSSASFSFSNHMYGTSVGSLSLEASTNGTTWTSLWSDSGNKGNQWNVATVNLSAYLGQSQLRLRFVGTTGTSWSSDIAIDNLSLTSGGGNPNPTCPTLNFNDFTITSFSNQDASGNFSVGSGGNSLTLTNNTWKYIPMNYTVTANTVIEFEFSSTSQGEIHGVAFENDNTLTAARCFKVHGSQNYGITNYDNYTSGTIKYTIPVGSSYTGSMDRLVFINDNDAGSGNNSTFSNVRIYEGSCESANVSVAEVFDTRVDIMGDEDEDMLTSIQVAPNPIKKGTLLKLVGPNKSLESANYSVINMLGQIVKKGNVNDSRTISIDQFNSGVYILKIENKFTNTSKRFIIE